MTEPQVGRAIVLGATGFVGTHVCTALVASGYEVLGVARGRPAREFPYTFLELDVSAAAASTIGGVVDSFEPDLVVNTIGSIWGRSDDQMWSAAAQPVESLLAGLRNADHRPWLVHLGSVLEYGTIGVGETANARRDAARPTGAYGEAKLAATESILDAVVEGHIDAVVLRIANVSGPGAPNISLLGQVARQLADAKVSGVPATITLDALTAQRDYVDARDVADAVVAAARVRLPGTVLDIGRGEAVGVREMVRMLLDISGVDAELAEREPATSGGSPRWTQVDIGPARDHLGWVPTRSIYRSIEDFWLDTIANIERPHTHAVHPTRA